MGAARMLTVLEIVTGICPEIQSELQKNLHGFFGGIIRGYLPQTWHFVTERGSATLSVDSAGKAAAHDGEKGQPDVVIRTTSQILEAALIQRDRSKVPVGNFEATPTTSKGKTAFTFLRGRFGL
jgi:hypothetical protein